MRNRAIPEGRELVAGSSSEVAEGRTSVGSITSAGCGVMTGCFAARLVRSLIRRAFPEIGFFLAIAATQQRVSDLACAECAGSLRCVQVQELTEI